MRLGSRRDWAKAVAKPRVSLLSQVLMKQSKQPIVRPAGGPSLLPSPRPTKESRSGSGGQPWVLGRGGEEIAAIIEFLGGADQAGCVGPGPLGPRVTPAAALRLWSWQVGAAGLLESGSGSKGGSVLPPLVVTPFWAHLHAPSSCYPWDPLPSMEIPSLIWDRLTLITLGIFPEPLPYT